jgi:hypothetical protein
MDAQKTSFIKALQAEFSQFSFRPGPRFKWKYPKSIFFEQNEAIPFEYFALQTLHELGHALSGHKDYKTDVERLKLESEAWQRAKREISAHKNWQIEYNEDFAENALDSYRDWLHQKSKCKKCGLTCFQTADGIYHCPKCDCF